MESPMKTRLAEWNAKYSERQKLQHVYLVIGVVGILVAGLITLLFPDLGHDIVLVALAALGAFLLNAVVWNLLKAGLLSTLPTRPRRK